MHCAPSNEIVASIWDNEPRRDSRKRIAPGFSCGPFTLHRPTCFQISGPPYSPPPAEFVSVAAPVNSHSDRYPAVPATCSDRENAGAATQPRPRTVMARNAEACRAQAGPGFAKKDMLKQTDGAR